MQNAVKENKDRTNEKIVEIFNQKGIEEGYEELKIGMTD